MLFDRIEPGSSRTDKECSFGAEGRVLLGSVLQMVMTNDTFRVRSWVGYTDLLATACTTRGLGHSHSDVEQSLWGSRARIEFGST
jgi:hypothetical protein